MDADQHRAAITQKQNGGSGFSGRGVAHMSDDAQVSVSSPATPLLPWPKNACTTLLALVDWSPIPVEGSPPIASISSTGGSANKGLDQWHGLMVWSRSWFRWSSPQGRVEKGWNWVAECNNIGERYTRKNVLFLRWRGERYIPKNVFFLR